MDDRVERELGLLRDKFHGVQYDNRWVLVPDYPLPEGWSAASTDAAFHIRDGYPGVSPYGIYVKTGIRFKGDVPNNFSDQAPTQPPFPGPWAIFSWEAEVWFATADVDFGHNLLTWVQGFRKRFLEGR